MKNIMIIIDGMNDDSLEELANMTLSIWNI